MGELTGALIGCGAIAREHLISVTDLLNVKMAAVCDISAARAEAAAERFGVEKHYTDYNRLIADIRPDLIHVTTPPSTHFTIVNTCLSAGLNVLCEKPIVSRYQDFRLLKEVAKTNHCMLVENQNFRFHSSVQRIWRLLEDGELGEVMDVQVCLHLNLYGAESPYTDKSSPHPNRDLPGGVIGDFLPHIAYLSYMFTGSILDVRTVWTKRRSESPLSADEFRGFIKGEHATAYVSFSGNAQPDGFWLRVAGTKGHVEANLFEPPRLTLRKVRPGEPSLVRLFDGVTEARAVFHGSTVGFMRKLGGKSSYDGLPEFISRCYQSIARKEPPPVSLDEIDAVADLINRLTAPELAL